MMIPLTWRWRRDRVTDVEPLIAVDERPTTVAGGRDCATPAPRTGESSAPGDTIRTARQAEDVLDQLARALALTTVPDAGAYDRLPDAFRAIYQRQAAAVAVAGWRPPVRTLVPASRVSVVAAVLVAHEMTVEDDCRCGWRGDPLMHAEHQASQLIALGVLG